MGINLQLHIAIGVGKVFMYHVGGADNQWQYVVAGEPFSQIAESLDIAKGGDVVIHPNVRSISSLSLLYISSLYFDIFLYMYVCVTPSIYF